MNRRSALEAEYAELLAERRVLNARIKAVAAELSLIPKPGEISAVAGMRVFDRTRDEVGVVVNRRGLSILVEFPLRGGSRVFRKPRELVEADTPTNPRSII